MADIFISYSKAERDVTVALARDLEAAGYTVWWDTSLVPGDVFKDVILEKIRGAKAAIVIWTPASVKSEWVYSEARRAKEQGKLVPLRTADVALSDIPPPFDAIETGLVDDRMLVVAAVAKLGASPVRGALALGVQSPPPMRVPTAATLPRDSQKHDAEKEHWLVIRESREPEAFRRFIAAYPDGAFLRAAEARLTQVERRGAPRWLRLSVSLLLLGALGGATYVNRDMILGQFQYLGSIIAPENKPPKLPAKIQPGEIIEARKPGTEKSDALLASSAEKTLPIWNSSDPRPAAQAAARNDPRVLQVARYERAAASGDTRAMLHLGLLFSDGKEVQQDFNKARSWFEVAAAAGEPSAMSNLGLLYDKGQGVRQDFVQARLWYERAAAAGDVGAMSNLGSLYQHGDGVPKDFVRARLLYEQAAARGDTAAMTNLGFIYQNGLGVTRDLVQAREWYNKAAADGDPVAMTNLGTLYQSGEGVPQDYARAREWFERSSIAGDTVGTGYLGALFHYGLGVPQDFARARALYEKAAAAKEPIASGSLAILLDGSQGGPRDATRAAKLLLASARSGNEHYATFLRGSMNTWTAATRSELKRELARAGHYNGAIDDVWDDATRAAVESYLKPDKK